MQLLCCVHELQHPAAEPEHSAAAAKHSCCCATRWASNQPVTDVHLEHHVGQLSPLSSHPLQGKKGTIPGDASSSKFSLGLGSSSKTSTTPTSSHTISGGGINDLAAAPCGTRVAAACRDGAVRLVDVASGTVIGGFQSYYGAMLCCAFSRDGRYLAAGGEDDLVTVYSVAERYLVAHCQGHDSWVSRVAFDAWMEPNSTLVGGTGAHTSGMGANSASGGAGGDGTVIYRLASVGQDAQLCLWDVQILPPEGDLFATPVYGVASAMRCVSSCMWPCHGDGVLVEAAHTYACAGGMWQSLWGTRPVHGCHHMAVRLYKSTCTLLECPPCVQVVLHTAVIGFSNLLPLNTAIEHSMHANRPLFIPVTLGKI